jgi:hypothetical protein
MELYFLHVLLVLFKGLRSSNSMNEKLFFHEQELEDIKIFEY